MQRTLRHVLFEHVSGYELFELRTLETLADESYADYQALTQSVTHISSLPFSNAAEAADAIRPGGAENAALPAELVSFLALNRVAVLYADRDLKHAVQAAGLEYHVCPAIMRGIRTHIHRFTGRALDGQQLLATAHLLSREAIRYDMEREDNLAIHVGHECEALEAEVSALSARISGLLDWRVPQFKKLIKGEGFNAQLASEIAKELARQQGGAAAEHQSIVDEAVEITRIAPHDLASLNDLNNTIIEKKRLLAELDAYLAEKLSVLAPNLRAILGDRLCFKLIHKAGGLDSLACQPASTLQLLGAEKSLFRSLKMRTRTPKYGMLYGFKGLKGGRGQMCRFIANKCSLAARIDAYDTERSDAYGKELRRLIDKKMAAVKTGGSVEQTQDLLSRVHDMLAENFANASGAGAKAAGKPAAGAEASKHKAAPDAAVQAPTKSAGSIKPHPANKNGNTQSGHAAASSNGSAGKKGKGLLDGTEASKRKAVQKPQSNKKAKKQ
ncbi:nucleolar protein 56 [Pancytospora philotis]|nr:nucleolar protein 56 [Pancytospora philotis]